MTESPSASHPALPPTIDTHCHLDDQQFVKDLIDVLKNSHRVNVTRWVLIGYDPTRWASAVSLATSTPGMFHTLGVHPSCAEQWNDDIAQRLRNMAASTHAVGIGETGLDFYRDNASLDIQAAAFSGQLAIAADLNLPVVIHMRDAEDEILGLLSSMATLPTLIFHSFDGGDRLVDFALETKSYVGMGGLATRQKSEALRNRLTKIPMERILLETDSPYLVPARQKDRRNQPAHIATIATMMAATFDTTPEQLAKITTANAERVFGLHNHEFS